jgi:hypothetical protein
MAEAAKRSREAEGSSRQIGFVSSKKGDEVRPVKEDRWDKRPRGEEGGYRGGSREHDAYRARDKGKDRDRDRGRPYEHPRQRDGRDVDGRRDRY